MANGDFKEMAMCIPLHRYSIPRPASLTPQWAPYQ